LALRLVDQVHALLGKHRGDDARTGWISGLSEEAGKRHPTIRGLRIGKPLNERKPADPYDERLEWDRDGQYFHYLTKWMHALNRVTRFTGNPIFNLWAMELAKGIHGAFVHTLPSGSKRMHWKMRIDLSSPLVPSMGQHDPLDGLITYTQLQATASEFKEAAEPDLGSEIADMEALCEGKSWDTEDPLGIGGLLCDAYRIVQLILNNSLTETALLSDLLESSLRGLDAFMGSHVLNLPVDYRLAFRELGLAIGLHAVERMEGVMAKTDAFARNRSIHARINRLTPYIRRGKAIEEFWLHPRNRASRSWTEHLDINRVMLATSLAPDGYLDLIES
jgi:hypothetical protein